MNEGWVDIYFFKYLLVIRNKEKKNQILKIIDKLTTKAIQKDTYITTQRNLAKDIELN